MVQGYDVRIECQFASVADRNAEQLGDVRSV